MSKVKVKEDWKFFFKLAATILAAVVVTLLVICGMLWAISFGYSSECNKVDLGVFGPLGVATISGLVLKFDNPLAREGE